MSTRKKRLLGTGIAALLLIGSLFLYQSLAAGWQVDKVRRLAAEARNVPKDQAKEAFSKVWAEAKKLSPEQRRQLFEEGSRARLKAFFDLSPEKKTAYLDSMIKRDLARQAEWKKKAAARSKAVAKSGQGQTKGQGQGQTKGQGGPGGQGGAGGRRNLSPEQRSAMRRDRLDRSSPNDRAMRSEFASAMRDRRKQLGLPAGGRRGGWR
jgi:hypothetical protein